MAKMKWGVNGKRVRVMDKGYEPHFPCGTPGKGLRLGKAQIRIEYSPKAWSYSEDGYQAGQKIKRRNTSRFPEDRKAPPKQKRAPTYKELSKAFKMRAKGKTSREIHDAFPHINIITIWMNKAKDHPDYCQSSTSVGKKKAILATDLKPFKRYKRRTKHESL